MSELAGFAGRARNVVVLDLDSACLNPVGILSVLSEQLGLAWTEACEAAIRARDRLGSRWEPLHSTAKVPGAWRRRLDASEVDEIERGLSRFQRLGGRTP
jgi:hypothetical protein